MPGWGWVLIAIGAAVVVAVVVWKGLSQRRTSKLRGRFGPEYERAVHSSGSRSEAEAELAARQERRDRLQIRPLSPESRERYAVRWNTVQAQFVDDPPGAVAAGDTLIQSAMRERGYPVEDFDQRAADLSVDHPHVVENYREGHRLAQASAAGEGSTEDLRKAMRHYRALFDEVAEPTADEPLARDPQADGVPGERVGEGRRR